MTEYAGKQSSADLVSNAGVAGPGMDAPGKRTLVEQARLAPQAGPQRAEASTEATAVAAGPAAASNALADSMAAPGARSARGLPYLQLRGVPPSAGAAANAGADGTDPKAADRPKAAAAGALGGGGATFSNTPTAPGGAQVVKTEVQLALVPPEYRGAADPASTVAVRVLVDGSRFVLDLQVGNDHWVAVLSPDQLIEQLAGAAAADLIAEIADIEKFVRDLAHHVIDHGTRLRINLTTTSFVVIDLAHVVRHLGQGQLVLRPVEMQLLAGKVAGLRVFRDKDVKAKEALSGQQIGGWFPVPDSDGRMRSLLESEPEPEGGAKKRPIDVVYGGVFADGGTLRFAIKESEKATAGAVLHVNFEEVLRYLKKFGSALGAKFEAWLAKLRLMIGNLDFSFLHLDLGKLHFGLPSFPGISFDFDLNLSLPHLFGGGGGKFDWSKLIPSFNLDMGSWKFGALPKVKFPWLKMPKLGGGWHLALPDFRTLIPSLPEVDLGFDLDLHWAGDFRIGIGVDLSGLIPDLPDFALGFELDLHLLASASAIGKWLLAQFRKLRDAGVAVVEFFKQWIHLGRDGVLRIYDATKPDGPMLGFHLKKLLDGAQETDLLPTEMRWNELEMGESDGGPTKPEGPSDKLIVHKPGKPLGEGHVTAGDHLAAAMSLPKGTDVSIGLYREGTNLVVISEAKSQLYKGNQAARASIDVAKVIERARKHLQSKPEAHLQKETKVELDEAGYVTPTGLRISYKGPKSSGYVEWTYAQLAEPSWDSVMPEHFGYTLKDSFGIGRGPVPASPPAVAKDRLELAHAPTLRHSILGIDDKRNDVYGMIHLGDGQVGVSITDEAASNVGAYAHVSPKFLLEQLKRLGKVGAALLEKIAKLVKFNLPSGGGDPFAFLDAIADRLINAWNKAAAALGKLRLEAPDFGFLEWNLGLQLPRLGDLDLSQLIPEFDLKFELPKIGDLHVNLELFERFKIGNPFGSIPLPHMKLPDFLSGLHLPNLKDLSLNLFSDLHWFTISINFPNLFGDGHDRAFGFHIPIQKLLDKAAAAARWIAKHTPNPNVHLGRDGILRIYDHANGNRVGYDITKLFDGYSPDDLIPVELHAGFGGDDASKQLVTLDYGKQASRETAAAATAPSKEEPGKTNDEHAGVAGRVLVARPPGMLLAANVKAPEWLVEHLGLHAARGGKPAAPQVHASLHFDGKGVTVFATADGSDRGVALHVNVDKFPALLDIDVLKGKTKGQIRFDQTLSMTKGMMVIAFGPKPAYPGAKVSDLHGHLGWKLDKMLESPSLESLLPDEFEIGRKEGEIQASNALDVTGLNPTAHNLDLSGFPLVESALGGQTKVDIFTKLGGAPRIAITVASEDLVDHAHLRQGVEIEIDEHYKQTLDTQIKRYAEKMKGAVAGVFSNTNRSGDHPTLKDLHLTLGATGLGVERGKDGEQDHMYARFNWGHIASLVTGDGSDLIPDEFRLATKTMALEVKDHVTEAGKPRDSEVPAGAQLVKDLHPLLREPLVEVGVPKERFIAIDMNASHVIDEAGNLRGLVHLYETASPADRKILHEKDVILDLNVEALIAQVMPSRQRKFQKDKPGPLDDAKRPAPGHSSFSASLHGTKDLNKDGKENDPGVDLTAAFQHTSKAGKRRDFELEIGWSATKVIELVMRLDGLLDADGAPKQTGGIAGLLVPDHVKGSYTGERFRISFSNENHHNPNDYSFDPGGTGIDDALAAVFDAETVKQAMIYLNLPDPGQVIGDLGKSIVSSQFVDLAHCILEVPDGHGGKKYYDVGMAFEPHLFRTIIGMIPALGTFIKIADVAIGIIKDPKGTLEGLRYAPEALVNIVKNAPQIFGAVKDMGFKKAITMFMFHSDVTTKQSVMMARYMERLEAAGVKIDKTEWSKLSEDEKRKRAKSLNVPEQVWEYLSNQDPEALRALAKAARDNNSPAMTEPLDPTVPDHQLTVSEIEMNATMAQLKYMSLERTMEEEEKEKDPAKKAELRKQIDQYANEIRAQLDNMVQYKAKGTPTEQGTDAPLTRPPGVIDYSENLPQPDPADEERTRALFDKNKNKDKTNGKDVVITAQEADYVVRKYAGLDAEQLATLLMGEAVIIKLDDKTIRVVMRDSERDFVRALWVKRVEADGYKVKRTDTGTEVTPEIDQAVVSAWRAHKTRAAVKADADAEQKKRDDKVAASKGTKPDPKDGKDGAAQGAGGGGHRPSLDNMLDQDELVDGEGKGKSPSPADAGGGKDARNQPAAAQGDGDGDPDPAPAPFDGEGYTFNFKPESFVNYVNGTVEIKPELRRRIPMQSRDGRELELELSIAGIHNYGNGFIKYRVAYLLWVDRVGQTYYHDWLYSAKTQQTHGSSQRDPVGAAKTVSPALSISGKRVAPGPHPTFEWGGMTLKVTRVDEVAEAMKHGRPDDPATWPVVKLHLVVVKGEGVMFDVTDTPLDLKAGTARSELDWAVQLPLHE